MQLEGKFNFITSAIFVMFLVSALTQINTLPVLSLEFLVILAILRIQFLGDCRSAAFSGATLAFS